MLARPGLPSFDYVRAASVEDVSNLLSEHGASARLLMGGTDLFPRMHEGLLRPHLVVDVKSVPRLRDIGYDTRDGLLIGAAASLNVLACHPDVQAHYPLLVEAANSVASYQVRNRATLGGNLCNASPAADMAPAALCLDAQVELYGAAGYRRVPVGDFFLGPGRTALEPDELMVVMRFPAPRAGSYGRYLKLGRNRAGDLASVGVAVYGYLDATNQVSGCRFRIALASVAPVPMRAVAAEEALAQGSLTEEWLQAAADAASESTSPIDDVRASAAYRREMVRNLVLRCLRDVTARLTRGEGRRGLLRGREGA